MSEPSTQTQSSSHKPGAGPLPIVLTLILVAGGIGAFALWRSSETPTTQAVAQSPAPSVNKTAVPEQSTASINALKDAVARFDASLQQVSDELADLKRQLAREQGERKLLTDQLGSLSSRVDSLAASAASRADTIASEPSQKKRAKSR